MAPPDLAPRPGSDAAAPLSERCDHILCVDDEEGILNALRQQLVRFEAEGIEIDLARSGQEAIDLVQELERDGESLAVVIADQIMPGMKGVDLLEEIHRRQPDTITILLTGQAGLNAVVQAINRAGLNRFIQKPWDEYDLRLTVTSLLGKYRLVRENRRLLDDLRTKNEELERRVSERTAELAAANVELAGANRRLEQLAITDGLTDLHNHRYFHERLASEVERAHRTQLPLSLLMIDVDHFKHYNDRNGHPAGDSVLRAVAQILKDGRRMNDTVARYGGEEFAVLLPDTPLPSARRLAETLRARVEEKDFEQCDSQPLGRLTISVGVACSPSDGATAAELLQAADDALYRAKEAGRNRVDPPPTEESG